MTAPRRFGGDDAPDLDPISFEIACWRRLDDTHVDPEPEWVTFHALGMLPGGAVFDLASYTDAQGRTSGAAMREFFNRAIVEDERLEFNSTIDDTSTVVLADDLAAVARWLNETYFPPTRRPSRRERRGSPGGRSSTGPTLTAAPHDADWT